MNSNFNLTIQADGKDSHPEIESKLTVGSETLASKNLLTLKRRTASDSNYSYSYSYTIKRPGTYTLTVKRRVAQTVSAPIDFQTIDWSTARFANSSSQNSSTAEGAGKIANETVFNVVFEGAEGCKIKAAEGSTAQKLQGASLTISQ